MSTGTRRQPPPASGVGPGLVVGERYQLLELIGGGNFGSVYRARDLATREIVAAKHFTDRDGGSHDIFWREASLHLRLRHPNIVQLLNLISAEGSPDVFTICEFVAGGNLRQLLRVHERLEEADALALLVPVADALAFAHARHIIHRDVKPENVLLAPPPGHRGAPNSPARLAPKVTDFGLARFLRPADLAATHHGSPAYMAPEQFYGEYGYQTDVYALGVMLYELTGGARPFQGGARSLMKAHIYAEPPSLETGSPALRELIARMMHKDPAHRLATMAEAGEAMRALLTESGGRAPRVAAPPAPGDPAGSLPAPPPAASAGPPATGASAGRATGAAAPSAAASTPCLPLWEADFEAPSAADAGGPPRLLPFGPALVLHDGGRLVPLDPATGAPVALPPPFAGMWRAAAVSPSGQVLAALGDDVLLLARQRPQAATRRALPPAAAARDARLFLGEAGNRLLVLADDVRLLVLDPEATAVLPVLLGFAEVGAAAAAEGDGDFYVSGRLIPRRLRHVACRAGGEVATVASVCEHPICALATDPAGRVVLAQARPGGRALALTSPRRAGMPSAPSVALAWPLEAPPERLAAGDGWWALGSNSGVMVYPAGAAPPRPLALPVSAATPLLDLVATSSGALATLVRTSSQALRVSLFPARPAPC